MKNFSTLYAKALCETTKGTSRNAGEGVIQRFVVRLKETGKTHLLPKIIFECEKILAVAQDGETVEVHAAHPLPTRVADELRKFFSRSIVKEQRDPSVLGGMRARVGDRVYDGTIRRQLEQVRCRF